VIWGITYISTIKDRTGKPEYVMVAIHDMTERKKAEVELKESESRFRSSFAYANVGFSVTDLKGRFIHINSAYEEITGYSKKELFKMNFLDLIYPDDFEENMILIKKLLAGEMPGFVIENRYVRKDKSPVWVRKNISVVRDRGGRVLNIVGIIDDISERKKLERQKDEFIGIASHELKTPVTSIKAYAQLLHRRFRRENEEKSAELLLKMDAQLNKLALLINDLLDVTKIGAGKLQFNSSFFDFNELVAEVIEEMQRTTERHKIITHLSDAGMMLGDRDRIGQVFVNLLSNAIKYSPKSNKIIVKTFLSNKELGASVRDFGTGIPKNDQKKIFERFYQASGVKKEAYPGLGLGLYISNEIVRRHKGRIWVESEMGNGSKFCLRLPVITGSDFENMQNRQSFTAVS
jgi:PAS domain S-box-containing protein